MKIKTKTCKICKAKFSPFSSTSQACSVSCAVIHAKEKEVKKIKKQHAKEKKLFKESDIKTRKAAAKQACHKYIKLRDEGLPCICCSKPMTGQIHAGHWLESGSNPIIRYNENNIHAQSAYCNTYKGGDSGDYEKNLRLKIGDKKVDQLKRFKGSKLRSKQIKRTASDYKSIELKYKQKLKELKG